MDFSTLESVKRLFHAILNKDIPIVRHLLDAGADPNLEWNGYLPLEVAAKTGHPAIMQTLLYHGADAAKIGSLATPALARAAQAKNSDCVEILLTAGAPVDCGGSGPSPLIVAATEGCVESMRLLLKAGADVDAIDIFKSTALMSAIHHEHLDCAKLAVEHGANLNHQDIRGDCAAHYAGDVSDPQFMSLLCSHGFDYLALNEHGKTVQCGLEDASPLAAEVFRTWVLTQEEAKSIRASVEEAKPAASTPRL